MPQSHEEILSLIAEAHDRNLLRIVQRGQITVIGPDGKPVDIDLTAAMINAITNRLKACQVTVALKPGSTIGDLAAEVKRSGLKLADQLPDHDYGDDAATA